MARTRRDYVLKRNPARAVGSALFMVGLLGRRADPRGSRDSRSRTQSVLARNGAIPGPGRHGAPHA